MNVTIIDSLMGTGKTTWAIDYMRRHTEQNFMYITPYLTETERIINDTKPERDFREPRRTSATDGKLDNLNDLIWYHKDIASTHELFKRFNQETKYRLLSSPISYTLIIDETLDVVTPVQIKPADIKLCIDKGLISVNEDGICKWVYENSEYDGRFADIKEVAQTNCMICVKDSFFVWRLDPDIFTGNYFDRIVVLTYLFEGSIMKTYLEYYGISYTMLSVRNGLLSSYYRPDISKVAELVNLYDGKLNESFKQRSTDLSASWYKNPDNVPKINKLRKNMDNYFKNVLKAPAESILWSTFLAPDSTEDNFKSMLLAKTRYDDHFLSCNVRGVNKYASTSNLAYMINLFLNPGVQHFFGQKGLRVNADLYALQCMIQWIWRSRIRRGEPINVYIPSQRMYSLFRDWLEMR